MTQLQEPQQTKIMVSALIPELPSAIRAYEWLKEQGYSKNDISLLMSNETATRFHAIEHDDRVEDRKIAPKGSYTTGMIGASVGAGIVATLGSVLGFLMGGPLGAGLAASIPGAMVGGLVGGLVGYGFPEQTAKQYETSVHEGGVVLGVTLHSDEQIEEMMSRFADFDGRDVVTVS